jgi:hypothetical protein
LFWKQVVIAMTRLNHLPRAFALIVVLACLSQGCGKSDSPTADPKPFKAAVAQYLDQNNMAMALKQIKAGPTIEGKTATLTASLQHATIPGPAVTWTFRFEQKADGTWNAVSHK